MRNITYCIDMDTGLVFSRVGDRMAVPVLDFDGMDPGNGFKTVYTLEKTTVYGAYQGTRLRWTRKIPNAMKNIHRMFWGMKPLKGKNRWEA